MNNRAVTVEELSAYYDLELPSDQRAWVDEHISACPDCQSTLQRWTVAERELAADALRSRSRPRIRVAALATVFAVCVALVASGTAIAIVTGRVFGAGSQGVSLVEAHDRSGLPLVLERELPNNWSLRDVQLTLSSDLRMVGLRYDRPSGGSVNVMVWSLGTRVVPNGVRTETGMVENVPVTFTYGSDALKATFELRNSFVVVAATDQSVSRSDLESLIGAWIKAAQ